MYRTLLAQLLAQHTAGTPPPCLDASFRMAKHYGRTVLSSADRPPHLLKQLLGLFESVYIVLDGVDECKDIENSLAGLLVVVRSMAGCRALFVSRGAAHLRVHLREYPYFSITRLQMKPDIETYLTESMNNMPMLGAETKAQLLRQILDRSDGMFLYASLSMQELAMATSPTDLMEGMLRIPPGLNNLYRSFVGDLQNHTTRQRSLAR